MWMGGWAGGWLAGWLAGHFTRTKFEGGIANSLLSPTIIFTLPGNH